jgi:hypothetical protein
MDCGEEISGGFIVASGDGAVLLELAEEILDEVACLVSDMAGRDKALKSQRRRVIPYKYCLRRLMRCRGEPIVLSSTPKTHLKLRLVARSANRRARTAPAIP